VDLDDALISSTGTITPTINIIVQGITESNRIGRKVVLRKIGWRYNLNFVSQAVMATTSDTVRLIVYQDKQTNGATAAVTDILESASFLSFNNLSNSGRFRILLDQHHSMHAPTAIAGPVTGELDVHAGWFKDVNIPIEFSAATGAIAEIRSNNIGVLVISGVGGTKLTSKFRLRFSDS